MYTKADTPEGTIVRLTPAAVARLNDADRQLGVAFGDTDWSAPFQEDHRWVVAETFTHRRYAKDASYANRLGVRHWNARGRLVWPVTLADIAEVR